MTTTVPPALSPHTLASERNAAVRAAAAVFVAVFVLNASLAFWLYGAGAFDNYNRIFETDPNVRLAEIASSWSSGGELHWRLPQSLHALMPYLFSLPIRAMALLAGALGYAGPPEQLRNQMGLLAVPLANAVSAGMLSLLYSRLSVNGWRLVAANALTLVTFSNTVFGSVPDHFALTRTVSIASLWLVMPALGPGGVRPHRAPLAWLAVAVLSAGVTITNASFVATSRFAAELGRGAPWVTAIRRALLLAVLGAVVAVAIGTGLAILRDGWPEPAPGQLAKWLTLPTAERVSAVLGAVGESFLPLELVDKAVEFRGNVWPTIMMASTLEIRPGSLAVAALVLGLSGWGAWRLLRLVPAARYLVLASGLQFAGIALFFIWGDIPFLYSPHWLGGQQVLLAGLFVAGGGLSSRPAWIAALLFVAAAAVTSATAWRFIIHAVLSPVS